MAGWAQAADARWCYSIWQLVMSESGTTAASIVGNSELAVDLRACFYGRRFLRAALAIALLLCMCGVFVSVLGTRDDPWQARSNRRQHGAGCALEHEI